MSAGRRRAWRAWSPGAAGPVLGLTPVSDPRDATWRDFAICAQTDPDEFYPPKGVNPTAAVKICQRCPVREQCLGYALRTGQEFGVWGGLTPQERARLLRERVA